VIETCSSVLNVLMYILYLLNNIYIYIYACVGVCVINLLTPNVYYSGRTALLTSKVAFYIFIQQI